VNHEIYVFGSITRGEVSVTSDVDILVIPFGPQGRESYPENWSVYNPEIVESYYRLGRLFAWHLHLEARCLFSSKNETLLAKLGKPAPYTTYHEDIDHLEAMMEDALFEIRRGTNSIIYEIGVVHTAIRDIAMSASWKLLGLPTFSKDSPYLLPLNCPLSKKVYHGAMLARHSSTRGADDVIDAEAIAKELLNAPLSAWVADIRRAM
jgi:Nucleotidyltransferase domain